MNLRLASKRKEGIVVQFYSIYVERQWYISIREDTAFEDFRMWKAKALTDGLVSGRESRREKMTELKQKLDSFKVRVVLTWL